MKLAWLLFCCYMKLGLRVTAVHPYQQETIHELEVMGGHVMEDEEIVKKKTDRLGLQSESTEWKTRVPTAMDYARGEAAEERLSLSDMHADLLSFITSVA